MLVGKSYTSKDDLSDIFSFRYKLFIAQMGWFPQNDQGTEIDEFDTKEAIHLTISFKSKIIGYTRLIPTTQKTMLSTLFCGLMHGNPAPRHPRVFEASRFHVDEQGLSRTQIARAYHELVRLMVKVGFAHDWIGVVAATNLPIEKMLRSKALSLETMRLAPPTKLLPGVELALYISRPDLKITDETLRACGIKSYDQEILCL